jgi:hypothetical protein
VHLVDDQDLEAIARRSIGERLLDAADVVDAGVRGGVDLLHVDVDAGRDLLAGRTLQARRRRGTVHAVERLREDARARRLANPADTREQERVRDPALLNRVAEGARDVLLADEILERLRTPLSGKDQVAHRGGSAVVPRAPLGVTLESQVLLSGHLPSRSRGPAVAFIPPRTAPVRGSHRRY